MNLSKSVSRGLILPAFLAASVATPAFAAPGRSKTYHYTGNVAAVCKIGTSTSYAISILVTNGSGSNRNFTISLDGTSGNTATGNGSTTSVTKTYSTICNQNTAKTLSITIPNASSGTHTLTYTIVIKDQNNTQIGTATSPTGSTVTIPANTSANYTIAASSNVVNGTIAGTYTATVTIQ